MKKISPIRSLLGISQDDMARLLNVHRSQLSMFESGKRDLPREAKILLAPMLAHSTNLSLKQEAKTPFPDPKKEEHLKRMLQENELQRVSMARKLDNAKSLYQKNVATLNLAGFLLESKINRATFFSQLVDSIRTRAESALIKCDATALMQIEIKAELLELEKLLLEEYITKNTNVRDLKK